MFDNMSNVFSNSKEERRGAHLNTYYQHLCPTTTKQKYKLIKQRERTLASQCVRPFVFLFLRVPLLFSEAFRTARLVLRGFFFVFRSNGLEIDAAVRAFYGNEFDSHFGSEFGKDELFSAFSKKNRTLDSVRNANVVREPRRADHYRVEFFSDLFFHEPCRFERFYLAFERFRATFRFGIPFRPNR